MAAKTPERLFGLEIKKSRDKLGVSQEELAFRGEIHRTYVSQLERGIKSPTLAVMLRLAKALDTSAAELIGSVEKPLS